MADPTPANDPAAKVMKDEVVLEPRTGNRED